MEEVEELPTNVTSSTNGGTDHLNVLKVIICKLIIDNGSMDNLVATEMVEKLGLKQLKHPTPYRVSWLQKGHKL